MKRQIFFKNSNKIKSINSLNLDLVYYRNFLSERLSKRLNRILLKKIKWSPEIFNIMGKKLKLDRRSAWYADHGKFYKYSRVNKKPFPWIKELIFIKNTIEKKTNFLFNSVLLNDYKNGKVGMGWHSDDEKELGLNPIIASLSLGASRDFYLKNKKDKNLEKIKILIEDGSLLIMKGKTQHNWIHSLPKRLKIKKRRINLTFRKIV